MASRLHCSVPRVVALAVLLVLGGCGSRDDDPASDPSGTDAESGEDFAEGETSMPSDVEPVEPDPDASAPGGDTSLIEGVWDASLFEAGVLIDERYVSITVDGTWTLFDYDADQSGSIEQRNCFLVEGPLTLTPEGGDAYSLPTRTVFAMRNGDFLNVRFDEDVVEQSWPLDRSRTAGGFERCTET